MLPKFGIKYPDRLFEQLPVKIIALLIAILLWFHVKTVKVYELDLPATLLVENIPSDLVLTSELPDHILVKARGNGRQFLNVRSNSITYTLDFKNKKSVGESPFYLSSDKVHVPRGYNISVLSVPSYILCTFDNKVSREVRVQPVIGPSPPGFVLTDFLEWEPEKVVLEGPGKALERVETVPTHEFTVFGSVDSKNLVSRKLALNLPDIPGLSASPDSVEVRVELERIAERTLAACRIKPINIPEGRTVDIQPPTIDITYRGAGNILENLNPDSIRVVIDLKHRFIKFDENLKAVIPEFRGVEAVASQPEYFHAFMK